MAKGKKKKYKEKGKIGFVWPDTVRFYAARTHGVSQFYAGATRPNGFVSFFDKINRINDFEYHFHKLPTL
jgi:hypothetical protein